MKAVLSDGDRILLLRNEREEWELPGGRLEAGEDLRECLRREVFEETNLLVKVGSLLDAQVCEIVSGKFVLIVAFECSVRDFDRLEMSEEHLEVGTFGIGELKELRLPQVYRDAVRIWAEMIS